MLESYAWLWVSESIPKAYYVKYAGGANSFSDCNYIGTSLAAETIRIFILFYIVLSTTKFQRLLCSYIFIYI